jgi:hypothetical protein
VQAGHRVVGEEFFLVHCRSLLPTEHLIFGRFEELEEQEKRSFRWKAWRFLVVEQFNVIGRKYVSRGKCGARLYAALAYNVRYQ